MESPKQNHSFQADGSLRDLQKFVEAVYGLPNDRNYSVWDLLTQHQRFSMRALRGIRKGDSQKLKQNLLISLSWLMSMANRLHIDLDDEVWERFPYLCSYCGKCPCVCRATKPEKRLKVDHNPELRPKTLASVQKMFATIYQADGRNLADAGVHLAEEVGEVGEAIHNYLGEHKPEQFEQISLEMADYLSCTFGFA